jgi:hypothetical protein
MTLMAAIAADARLAFPPHSLTHSRTHARTHSLAKEAFPMRSPDDVVFLIILVVGLGAFVVGLVLMILFLLTLSKCLSRVRSRCRDMEPGEVWLNLVPCFGMIWIFFTVIRVGSSLEQEFRSRRWEREGENFGVGVGLAFAILSIVGAIPIIPIIGPLCGLACLICWIIYWVQIANYSSRLARKPADEFDDDDDDDDDDRDRPPRKRRPIRYEDEDEDDRDLPPRKRRSLRDDDEEPGDRIRRRDR